MVTLKSFQGLRPSKEFYPKVISKPYDVVSFEDCLEIVKNNPDSLIKVSRSEVDFPEDHNPYSRDVYIRAKENLEKMIKNGILKPDSKKSLYLYRLEMGNIIQTGIVGCVSAYDYLNGKIKKHENTRKDKEEDRINHIDITNTQLEPVFLAYRSKKDLDDYISRLAEKKPEVTVKTEDNIVHTLWVIENDDEIKKLQQHFESIDALYVADGHHRTAAGAIVAQRRDNGNNKVEREYQFLLSVIFSHESLNIMAYNRAVKDLNQYSAKDFIQVISNNFEVTKTQSNDADGGFKPISKKQIGMYLNGEWYLLKIKNNLITKDPVASLDVSLLQDYLLKPYLGIDDPRTDKRIDFIGGIKGTGVLKKLVDDGRYAVTFSMYPTSMNELLNVADSNQLMPPKSTWFEPKLRSGMVIHTLD